MCVIFLFFFTSLHLLSPFFLKHLLQSWWKQTWDNENSRSETVNACGQLRQNTVLVDRPQRLFVCWRTKYDANKNFFHSFTNFLKNSILTVVQFGGPIVQKKKVSSFTQALNSKHPQSHKQHHPPGQATLAVLFAFTIFFACQN